MGKGLRRWLTQNNKQIFEVAASTIGEVSERATRDGPTGIYVKALRPLEQPRLRGRLSRVRSNAPCGICGEAAPARYLNAAHVKPRAYAADAEDRDDNIAMLACLLGSDQAFECGDIRVTEGGVVELGNPEDPFSNRAFGPLVGTAASTYHEGSAGYFAAPTNSSPRQKNRERRKTLDASKEPQNLPPFPLTDHRQTSN